MHSTALTDGVKLYLHGSGCITHLTLMNLSAFSKVLPPVCIAPNVANRVAVQLAAVALCGVCHVYHAVHGTAHHTCSIHMKKAQHSTAQHSTAQHSTAQHSNLCFCPSIYTVTPSLGSGFMAHRSPQTHPQTHPQITTDINTNCLRFSHDNMPSSGLQSTDGQLHASTAEMVYDQV